MNKKVFIFDICDTLYESNTTLDFIYFIQENFFKKLFLRLIRSSPSKLVNKFTIYFFKIDFIRSLFIANFNGFSKETILKKADFFLKNYLDKKKNAEVFAELSRLPKEQVFLVSATVDPVAIAIAKELGVSYLSSQLAYDSSGICLGKLAIDLLGNKSKYFEDKKIALVVTDNKSDLNLCQMAESVIAVSKKKNINFWRSAKINLLKIILT